MLPKLFDLPVLNVPINSYGFCIMIGFLLGTWFCSKRGKALGLNTDIVLDVAIIAMIFGIIGAKINYVLQYPAEIAEKGKAEVFNFGDGGYTPLGGLLLGPIPYLFWWWRARAEDKIRLYSWQNGVLLALTVIFAFVGCRGLYLYEHRAEYGWKVFTSWQAGFVWYGGLGLGVPAGILYAKMRKQSMMVISDLMAPSIMLGLGFGRIGCFLNGCCYGAVTKFFLAIKYPKTPRCSLFAKDYPAGVNPPVTGPWSDQEKAHLIPWDSTHSLSVHPAQLYETVACFAMFFVLSWYWKKQRKRDGETILLMVILYGLWRFFVEYLRSDPRPGSFGFTFSQIVGAVSVVVCSIWFYFLRTRPAPASAPQPEKK